MPGIFLQTALFSGATTALGVAADLQAGILDRFRSLPMARSAVLAGRKIADLVRSVLVLIMMVVVGLLVGFRFQGPIAADIGGLALVLLFGYAFSWIFATIGLALRTPEAAGAAGFTVLFPFIFASSAFVSVTSMPGWLQAFANVQPITAMANSVRALLDGGSAGTGSDRLWPGRSGSLSSSRSWPYASIARSESGRPGQWIEQSQAGEGGAGGILTVRSLPPFPRT